jgi:hypothetical protein
MSLFARWARKSARRGSSRPFPRVMDVIDLATSRFPCFILSLPDGLVCIAVVVESNEVHFETHRPLDHQEHVSD